MKGHVAPEKLNGGLNNHTSASIVFDRLPPPTPPPPLGGTACCSTAHLVVMEQVAQPWLPSLYSKVPHSILWPALHGYIHTPHPPSCPPPPLHAFPLPPLPARLDAGMSCLTPSEKVLRAFTALWCGVCVCVWRAFIEQLSQCVCVCVCVLQQGSAWQPESVACPCVRMWKCVTVLVCESAVKCCPAAPPGCQLRFTMLN